MKQYQDERTLQVRNRIYAELMRIMGEYFEDDLEGDVARSPSA